LRHLPVKCGRFLSFWGVSRWLYEGRAAFRDVPGGQGEARAPEWWFEGSRRDLDYDFQFEVFFCQPWSFCGLLRACRAGGWGLRAAGRRLGQAKAVVGERA